MNQEEMLKDSKKLLEDGYRMTKKTAKALADTTKFVGKPTLKLLSVAFQATGITAKTLLALLGRIVNKDLPFTTNEKVSKEMYAKGIPLSTEDYDLKDLKLFRQVMKAHHVEYAINKDPVIDGRYQLFFLGKDAEMIEKACERYLNMEAFKDQQIADAAEKLNIELPGEPAKVKEKIDELKNAIQNTTNQTDKEKHKEALNVYKDHYANLKRKGKEEPKNFKESTIKKLEQAKEKAKTFNAKREKVKNKQQERSL